MLLNLAAWAWGRPANSLVFHELQLMTMYKMRRWQTGLGSQLCCPKRRSHCWLSTSRWWPTGASRFLGVNLCYYVQAYLNKRGAKTWFKDHLPTNRLGDKVPGLPPWDEDEKGQSNQEGLGPVCPGRTLRTSSGTTARLLNAFRQRIC